MPHMRLAQIRSMDISNGPGVGISIFTQGCDFHCKGCHNPEQWNLNGGQRYTPETQKKILSLLDKPYIKRLSILGGEPLLDRNRADLAGLVAAVPQDIDIWLYTGYELPDLINAAHSADLLLLLILHRVNYIVDGRFIEDKKDITLAFRGSSNQKIWKRKGINPYSFDPAFEDVTAEFDENN